MFSLCLSLCFFGKIQKNLGEKRQQNIRASQLLFVVICAKLCFKNNCYTLSGIFHEKKRNLPQIKKRMISGAGESLCTP